MLCGAGLPLIHAVLLPFMPRLHWPPPPPVSPDSSVCKSGSWGPPLLITIGLQALTSLFRVSSIAARDQLPPPGLPGWWAVWNLYGPHTA
eukprot:2712739-Rhodomonas_salina.1